MSFLPLNSPAARSLTSTFVNTNRELTHTTGSCPVSKGSGPDLSKLAVSACSRTMKSTLPAGEFNTINVRYLTLPYAL